MTLSARNTNHTRVLAILFLSLTMEKQQPSMEERRFVPRRIVNFSHPGGSEGSRSKQNKKVTLAELLAVQV